MRSIILPKMYNRIIAIGIVLLLIFSCNDNADYSRKSPDTDSMVSMQDSLTLPGDSAIAPDQPSTGRLRDTVMYYRVDRPDILIKKPKQATGTALVYCPSTMLRGIPAIINATISKDELQKALDSFRDKIGEENPQVRKEEIARNIKTNQINIYETMGVTLEFDPEDFKEVSKDEIEAKSFGDRNSLEWEWYLKPLHTTRRSIINFKFYYVDPASGNRNYLLEKTISVAVRVDPRTYVDQWKDFLLGDPKNTTTAIIIPLVTFLGGFLTGRKKKKEG